jgi:hypothetical protein
VEAALGGRAVEALAELPETVDADKEALMSLSAYSYVGDQKLFCLHIARMVALSIEEGPVVNSALWYGAYSWVLAGFFDDYSQAARFAKLAWMLAVRHGVPTHETQVLTQMSPVSFWVHGAGQALAEGRAAFQKATDSGHVTFANHATLYMAAALVASGEPLDRVAEELDGYLAFVRYPSVRNNLILFRQLVRALRGRTRSLSSLGDEHFHDPGIEPWSPTVTCLYWNFRRQLAFIADDHPAALQAAERARPLAWAYTVRVPYRDFLLYDALTLTALFTAADEDRQRAWREILDRHAARMRLWFETNPRTFGSNHALLAAELARIEGRMPEAEQLFDRSIKAARESGLAPDEAVACQVAARFYRQQGLDDQAGLYLQQSRAGYARWGAEGKLKQLDERPSPASR